MEAKSFVVVRVVAAGQPLEATQNSQNKNQSGTFSQHPEVLDSC
jgi:hypothetical protein